MQLKHDAIPVWLERRFPVLHARLPAFLRLTRLDRPIGTFLLLWPTLGALWIAAGGWPRPDLLVIFFLGTFATRSAGCCINDFADRNVDGAVFRTRNRPLVTGAVSSREALLTFAGLAALAFILVLLTNGLTVLMSFGALAVMSIYPFMKRYTHLPQVVLGIAFSWGILMAFTAQRGHLPAEAWLLFVANALWTVAYDTQYAMADREYDLKVGIKSTAILFGDADRLIIGILQALFILSLHLAARAFGLGAWFYLGLAGAVAVFVWQHFLIRERRADDCFRAFLSNNAAGASIFAGLFLHYLLG